jgi:hypothetical protein
LVPLIRRWRRCVLKGEPARSHCNLGARKRHPRDRMALRSESRSV